MEGNLITIALLGSPEKEKNILFRKLIQKPGTEDTYTAFPVPRGTYCYCSEEYLLLNLPEKGQEPFTAQLLSSGRTDIFLFMCSAGCLEQGLKQLSKLLKLPAVKEEAPPVIFCINFSRTERKENIVIDFDLLEDVLQIPVLPCYLSSSIYLDDIKTAISSVWNRIFSYDCLDFSPRKLAAETTSWLPSATPSRKENLDFICLILFLVLFLIWFFITGAEVPSLSLWRIIYWVEKWIAAS